MTRAQLESIADEYITRSIEITKRAMAASGFKMEDMNEIIMVGGQTRMPKIVEEVKKVFGKTPNLSINPDEVVALGAAVQAGVLQGDVRDVLLLDVIPLSLGIETLGGVATKLIERNTTIPSNKSQVFSTAADNQTSVEIHIVQGERPMAADNKSLGTFTLDGIPPAPRGVPQIEVTFDIDANGILTVTAKDKATGKSQSITIQGGTGLSNEEVEKMKKAAEEHAEEDEKAKKLIETKNKAEHIVYTAEKALKDAGDKVAKEVKKEVEEKTKELKELIGKEHISSEDLDKKVGELSDSLQKIGQAAYQKSQSAPDSQEPKTKDENKKKEGESNTKDKDVEEGEVVE